MSTIPAMATQDEYVKTAFRLPRDLHADIQASAEQNGRSMNAEIIARLQDSFLPMKGLSEADISDILELLQELVKQRKP